MEGRRGGSLSGMDGGVALLWFPFHVTAMPGYGYSYGCTALSV